MSSTITPNMNLTLPGVSSEPGPAWASEINSDITILDSHNHSPGSGVQITPSGINISSDLTFNSHSATTLLSASFVPQSSVSTLAALYVTTNGELTYNDDSGNMVAITKNGFVNAGAGSITGLASPASASYGSGTFTWQSDSGAVIAANMDFASAIFRNNTAHSKGLTLSPPNAMGANFTLVLPSIPSAASFVTLDNSGNFGTILQSSAFVGAGNIAPGGVSAANQIANGIITTTQISPTAGITASQLASGVALTPQTVTFSTVNTGSWVVPSGVTEVWATLLAAGGGGGSGATDATGGTQFGGGGGSGSIPFTFVMAVTPAASIPLSVGSGGAGGTVVGATNPGHAGTAGGNTTFNGITVFGAQGGGGGQLASGGTGGAINITAPVTNTLGQAGGAPNTSLGGSGSKSSYAAGGAGGSTSNATSGNGGGGGAGVAAGGAGGSVFGAGSNAAGLGGGGGGGSGGTGSPNGAAGGNGGDGQIVLVYFA